MMVSRFGSRVGRAAVLGLALASSGLVGCTAKYEQFLDERDREIAALKEEKAALQVQARAARDSFGANVSRVRELERENAKLRTALDDVRSRPAPTTQASAELRDVAKRNGLELRERAEGVALVLPNSVTFRSGSAALSKRGKSVLASVATTLKRQYGGRTISIEGHTDSTPIRKSKFGTNFRLSAERAESVRSHLAGLGVGGSKVRVVGYGPTQPVASNGNDGGRAKNRRVELVILNG